jgi:hypothetical protein
VNRNNGPVVPLRFDLSALVRRSVATLYSHLVTRPTGEALRLGIESQISELGTPCISVLDFSEVVVLDYSCADETVAKLIRRYCREDPPVEAYFMARGVADRHKDTLEAVLVRQGLTLVAETEPGESERGAVMLLGERSEREQAAWTVLQRLGRADTARIVDETGDAQAADALESLVRRRLAVRNRRPDAYEALTSLLAG